MIYLENEIPDKVGYLILIGDLHLGDPNFRQASLVKVRGYVKWVKENKNSRVILGGDLFNVATRVSPTQPFDQQKEEFEKVIEIFEPIKKQIVGAIDGNHEFRLIDFANFSLMNAFCQRLGIKYMGVSGVVRFKVGKHNKTMWRQNYYVYCHHTIGGGRTAGACLNAVEKLTDLIQDCDVYAGFHNHTLACEPREIYYPSPEAHKIKKQRQWLVSCGSYLEYEESYAERKMLPPKKLGSPRVRFSGTKCHDVHVSI